jgi:uncharacterized protein
MEELIGRDIERKILDDVYNSPKAELVVVYGRRRVGKTYLIKKHFEKEVVFNFTGTIEGSVEMQLDNFNTKLCEWQKLKIETKTPEDWTEALNRLKVYLKPKVKKKKVVVFLDEFPWIDSQKSGFLAAFGYFWNDWCTDQPNLKVIICGSAASWMIRKVIRDKGGLHNRVTEKIRLLPFTLDETERFLKSKKINLEQYHIAQLYMILGGIPHYLNNVKPGESVAQTIDRMCFLKDGLLNNEFVQLYSSLFHKFSHHVEVVKKLSTRAEGFTRKEIIETAKISSGGTTTLVLQELEESGFIKGYKPFDKKKAISQYKLIDEFTIFYFKFIENQKVTGSWDKYMSTASWKVWSGFAFEALCQKHIVPMKQKLGISGVFTTEACWRTRGSEAEKGVQIDLLIDRNDQSINLCEMKFSGEKYTIDATYAEQLQEKIRLFKEKTKTRKSIFVTMVTVFGLVENEYRYSRVQNEIKLEDLFKTN